MKYEINKDYEYLISFLKDIKNNFNKNVNFIHKARNELKVLDFEDKKIVVKSFKIPNFINKIVYSFFKSSKAKKSYEYSLKIAKFTPKTIGYVEFYENSLLKESYFLSEKFEYDFTIREPLLNNNFENKNSILKAFARFTFELHENEIYHKDYSPGNILIKRNMDSYEFKIVDINRMEFGELNYETRARSFSKLWASNEELKIISIEYNLFYKTKNDFYTRMCYYSNKNKMIKNFKKRVKNMWKQK